MDKSVQLLIVFLVAFITLFSFLGGILVGSNAQQKMVIKAAIVAGYAHYDAKTSEVIWDDLKVCKVVTGIECKK